MIDAYAGPPRFRNEERRSGTPPRRHPPRPSWSAIRGRKWLR